MAVRNVELGQKSADVLNEKYSLPERKLVVMQLDIGSQDSIKAFFEAFKTQFGYCDILLNNAGVALGGDKFGTEVVQNTANINFFGTKTMCELFLPIVKSKIINCTSLAGKLAVLKNKELEDKLRSLEGSPDQLVKLFEEYLKMVEDGTNETQGWTSEGHS